MELKYNGATLTGGVLSFLIEQAKVLNVPPSYLITKLHYEGLWGTSATGKTDNNWSGMSMSSNEVNLAKVTRPSGIVATKGIARPQKEGGYYYRYQSVQNFLTDWLYLIRRGGSYKVADSVLFSDAVKGMFQYGGAKYDYATMDLPNGQSKERYLKYLSGMNQRRASINNYTNGALDSIDKGVENTMTQGTAQAIIAEAKKMLGVAHGSTAYNAMVKEYNDNLPWAIANGGLNPKPRNVNLSTNQSSGMYDWCAGFISVIAKRAGAIGTVGYEIAAERLGKHQHQSKGTWLGRVRPKEGDLILFAWNGKGGWADHIGLVVLVAGDTIHTIEGNTGNPRAVRPFTYKWNDGRITGYARPKYRTSTAPTPTGTKSVAELANEVLQDKWGKGADRASRLKSAGYDADAVQKEVNRILNNVEAKKSNEEVAKEVVKGTWGNNPDRSKKLIEAGYDVNAIQKLVNDILNQPKDTEVVDVVEVEPVDKDRLNLKSNEFEIDGRVYEVQRK